MRNYDRDPVQPQRNLFGQAVTVTPEFVQTLAVPDHKRPLVAALVADRGFNEVIVPYLTHDGTVDDAADAVLYAAETLDPADPSTLRISIAPSHGSGRSVPLKLLLPQANAAEQLPGTNLAERIPFYPYGTLGHAGVAAISERQLRHRLGRAARRRSKASPKDLCDTAESDELQYQLFPPFDVSQQQTEASFSGDVFATDGTLTDEYACALSEKIAALLNPSVDLYHLPAEETGLTQLLANVLPEQVEKIVAYGKPDAKATDTLVLLSLAQLLVADHDQNHIGPIFSEIPVMDGSRSDMPNAGRMDAVTVIDIDGVPPTPEQQAVIDTARLERFSSIAQLHARLCEQLGANWINFMITDWKFEYGDGAGASRKIGCDVYTAPRRKHMEQLEYYANNTDIGIYLTQQDGDGQPFSFGLPTHVPQVRLVYVMANTPPIVYTRSFAPDEREAFFQTKMVPHYIRQERAAMVRDAHRQLANQLIEQPGAVGKRKSRAGAIEDSSLFSNFLTYKDIVEEMQYADNDQVLKISGRRPNGIPRYILQYDTLLQSIAEGRTAICSFSPESGGFITCPSPDHDDENPSAKVYLTKERGNFYCFSCGVYGDIDPASIPANLDLPEFTPNKVTIRRSKEGRKYVDLSEIPETHYQFMGTVQNYLAEAFARNAVAKQYMVNERGIPLALAEQYGVGFGDHRIIGKLLKAGYTEDDLFYYGILQRSKKTGRPFFALRDRVTFPLGYEAGKHTNIYGRSIEPNEDKRFRHRKLATNHTRVSQGMACPEAFTLANDEIVIVEGVMDKLALDVLGYPHSVSLIGTDVKDIAARVVEQSDKYGISRIGIALDADKVGIEKTAMFANRLRNDGFNGDIYSFTDQFVSEHPEWQNLPNVKDFNGYLTAMQRTLGSVPFAAVI